MRTSTSPTLRFAFTGNLGLHDPTRTLDAGIVRTLWMAPNALRQSAHRHRSPLLSQCMEDHLRGRARRWSCSARTCRCFGSWPWQALSHPPRPGAWAGAAPPRGATRRRYGTHHGQICHMARLRRAPSPHPGAPPASVGVGTVRGAQPPQTQAGCAGQQEQSNESQVACRLLGWVAVQRMAAQVQHTAGPQFRPTAPYRPQRRAIWAGWAGRTAPPNPGRSGERAHAGGRKAQQKSVEGQAGAARRRDDVQASSSLSATLAMRRRPGTEALARRGGLLRCRAAQRWSPWWPGSCPPKPAQRPKTAPAPPTRRPARTRRTPAACAERWRRSSAKPATAPHSVSVPSHRASSMNSARAARQRPCESARPLRWSS